MALTYATLQTQIADFLNRDDLTAQIPTFILMAEAAFNRDIRHWKMETRLDFTVNERYEDVPADWLQTIRLSISGKRQLDLVSQAKLMALREGRGDTAGNPRFYSTSVGQFEFLPTPDADYDASLIYLAKIPELTVSATTNWLLLDSPDAYIYGALLHSAPYLQEDARVAVWAGLYKDAANRLNTSSKADLYGGSGLTMR